MAGRRGGARRAKEYRATPEAKAAYVPTPPPTGTPAHAHEEHEAPSTEARAARPLALRGKAGWRGGARRKKEYQATPEFKKKYSPTPPPTGTPAHAHEEHEALAQSHAYSSAHASQRFPAPARIFARRGRGVVSGSGSEDGAVRAQGEGTGDIGSIKQAEAKNRRREGKVCSRPHAPARCTPCRPFVALDAESRIRKSKRACALRT